MQAGRVVGLRDAGSEEGEAGSASALHAFKAKLHTAARGGLAVNDSYVFAQLLT